MLCRTATAITLVFATCCLPSNGYALEKGGDTPGIPERNILDKFVGTWQGEVNVKSADGKETSHASRNTFAWILNGRFLRDEGGAVSGASSFLGLWSFDPGMKAYRSWYFLSPGGEAVSLTYQWEEKDQSLRGLADLGGGMTMEAVDLFKGSDAYEWQILVKDKEGKTLSQTTGQMKRIP